MWCLRGVWLRHRHRHRHGHRHRYRHRHRHRDIPERDEIGVGGEQIVVVTDAVDKARVEPPHLKV